MDDEVLTFGLCRDDWQIVVDALYEAVADRMSRARAIGPEILYGRIMEDDAQRIKTVADYLNLWLPETEDDL